MPQFWILAADAFKSCDLALIELSCVEILRQKKILLCRISLITFLAPPVIPYNPSSHESLDHVGEEKEVKYVTVLTHPKAHVPLNFKVLVM